VRCPSKAKVLLPIPRALNQSPGGHSKRLRSNQSSIGQNVMTFKPIVGSFLMMLLIISAPVIAGAQTQSAERASVPQRGSKKYWLVGEFADSAVHFAYAKRVVKVHEGLLTDGQCQQYSRIAIDYANQLSGRMKSPLKVNSGTMCARTRPA
jgi:hypothetical protein